MALNGENCNYTATPYECFLKVSSDPLYPYLYWYWFYTAVKALGNILCDIMVVLQKKQLKLNDWGKYKYIAEYYPGYSFSAITGLLVVFAIWSALLLALMTGHAHLMTPWLMMHALMFGLEVFARPACASIMVPIMYKMITVARMRRTLMAATDNLNNLLMWKHLYEFLLNVIH